MKRVILCGPYTLSPQGWTSQENIVEGTVRFIEGTLYRAVVIEEQNLRRLTPGTFLWVSLDSPK